MNCLNSILIEGRIADNPIFKTTEKGVSFCHFSIISDYFYKSEDVFIKEETPVDIVVYGKLGETCQEIGRIGSNVRVVGRLRRKNSPAGILYIEAEHVVFKPECVKERKNADIRM